MEAVKDSELKINGSKPMLIIEGIRENGSKFRPSDWPERLSSTFAVFGRDHRLHYANGIRPQMFNGDKVLVMDLAQKEINPAMFQQVMRFAHENKLRIREID